MIFEFRDFVLSLFTMREDTDLHNYAVRLVQMKKKYDNLLYGCDELMEYVMEYMSNKYGIQKNPIQEWEVSVDRFIQTITDVFPKVRVNMIEVLCKQEQARVGHPDETEVDAVAKFGIMFEKLSDLEIVQLIFSNESSSKLGMVAQELLDFKKRDPSEKLKLSSVPIVKKLMRYEMKRDKDQIRVSSQIKIFREMTEKSILRTIYFYHKRDSNPFEWRKFNPGPLDYSWTGSSRAGKFKVIFEEEMEEETEEKTEEEPIEEEKQEMPITVENGETNVSEDKNGQKTQMKIVLQTIQSNGVVGKQIAGEGTKFKFTLRKNPEAESLKMQKKTIIEEEKPNLESLQKAKLDHSELKPIGKGLAGVLEKEKGGLEIEGEQIEDEGTRPGLLDFIKPEDQKYMAETFFKMTGKIPKLYLIKWKNMSYNQCTWEVLSDLEEINLKIEDFQKHNRALDKDHRSQALDKKRGHRRVLEAMSKGINARRSGGYNSVYNEYNRVLYREMRSDNELNDVVIGSLNKTFKGERSLKKYQVESLKWMIERRRNRKNFILADEMGLGKTIQSMAFCLFLKVFEKLDGPFLIVAPLSTLPHWKKTFEEWTSLNVILYHDNESKRGREQCRDLEWYQKDIRLTGEFSSDSKICKFHVIITSFEVFSQDVDEFVDNLCIQQIIIDEAHRLKNQNAKVIRVFQRLPCRRISLLTGTPIQNNINELWSLLNFIEPYRFSDQWEFERNFKDIQSKEQLMHLKEILKPFMIRRMKNEVETIPPLEETLLEIELTNFQKVSYKTLYEKNKGILQKGTGLGYLTSMNNLEMQLRKCCNHPFLIREIQDKVREEVYTQEQYVAKMLQYSAKMMILDQLITKYKKEQKKMLIFSQFTEMLKLIEEFLTFRKIMHKKIDGATKARDRQNAIEAFNSNPDVFEVFLLSTKAGGLGINLTSANVVLIYDSDWNPQNDVQAIARAHRIGQTELVNVYRLISKKTYEAEMYRRASKKLGLDQAVFLSGQNNSNKKGPPSGKGDMLTTSWMVPKASSGRSSRTPKISDKDIELLLRKGILGLLDEEEDEAGGGQAIDIDELIKNSRRTNYSMINDKYTITRMKIDTEKTDKKVEIDDPNFWTKVLKDEETMAKKLLKEFEQLKENNDFMDEDSQTTFFKKLNEEVYQYVEKAKKGEVNYEDEKIFQKILQQINDDPFVRENLRTISLLLMEDIRKKPRRLKKRDVTTRKRVNKKIKKKTEDHQEKKKKGKVPEEDEFIIVDKEVKGRKDSKKKGKALGKRAKIEDEGLYRNSDSEENIGQLNRPKRKSKAKKKVKTQNGGQSSPKASKGVTEKKLKKVKTVEKSVNMNAPICIFCKKSHPLPVQPNQDPNAIEVENPESPGFEPIETCVPCKRTFHVSCLRKHISIIVQGSNFQLCNSLRNFFNENEDNVFDKEASKCLNCQVGLIDCFICKSVGKIQNKVDALVGKNVKQAILNSTRSMQRDDPSAFLYEELGNINYYYSL